MDGKILGTPDYQITKVEKGETKKINDVVMDLFKGKKPAYDSYIVEVCVLQWKENECNCDQDSEDINKECCPGYANPKKCYWHEDSEKFRDCDCE